MPRKRGSRANRREPVGVGLTPFLIYVSEQEVAKDSSLSRSEIICRLMDRYAQEKGYSKDDPEYATWLRNQGYVPATI